VRSEPDDFGATAGTGDFFALGFVAVFCFPALLVADDDREPLELFLPDDGSASVVAVGVFAPLFVPFLDPDVPVVVVAAGVVAVAALWAVELELSSLPQPANATASRTAVVAVSLRGTARTMASATAAVCRD
jgi:hypothetical protein